MSTVRDHLLGYSEGALVELRPPPLDGHRPGPHPCPPWCVRDHADSDHPEDATHHGSPVDVLGRGARIAPATLRPVPQHLEMRVQLTQHPEDDRPWLLLSETEGAFQPLLIAPDTAGELAAALEQALAAGRRA